ncbi:hypothetical protein [Mycolicibacterium parafortuitum]|uniref:DUF115 domain-containing protein n=1 Tax=Mycolicibacterium parafortuitum TaxID=39692 RepID=A0A375YHQ2_MYCPF|nr:hypothetical protein [Mycolicibacterium parafortuitum]SRX80630.1 hypothetical protein [Synechocystis sp. PCC 6803] [Mycolicibacterium parafortuitum]
MPPSPHAGSFHGETQFAIPPAELTAPITPRRQKFYRYPLGARVAAVRDGIQSMRSRRYIAAFAASADGRRSLQIFNALYDQQHGQTGVIVCNGPSLNKTDLSPLANVPYILMNRGYLLADRLPAPPIALCVSAPLVLEQYGNEIAGLETNLFLSAEHRQHMARTDRVAYTAMDLRWQFATRIGSSLFPGYTVTFLALQLAYHFGWTKVLIIGMDHRYSEGGNPRVIATTQGSDPNHFDPNYFGHGSKWAWPALQMNDHSYKLARHAYESVGRRVIDCTVDGACDVFTKGDFAKEAVNLPSA